MKKNNITQLPAVGFAKWALALLMPFLLSNALQAQQNYIACSSTETYVQAQGQAGTTFLGTGDDVFFTLALPFNFTFYGVAYNAVRVGANGYITFPSTAARGLGNVTLPSTLTGGAMYPFWDDLDADQAVVAGSGMYYRTDGVAPNRVFTIEWYRIGHFNMIATTGDITFQVKLFETSNEFRYCYQDVFFAGTHAPLYDRGLSATVGVEGQLPAPRPNTLWSFNQGVLNNNQCISFTLPAACNPTPSGNISVSTGSDDCSADVTVPLPTLSPSCSANSISYNVAPGNITGSFTAPFPASITLNDLPQGVFTITWTVTQAGCVGTAGSATQTITVLDQVDPVVNCPADIIVTLAPGDCSEFVSYNVTAEDNCPFFGQPTSLFTTSAGAPANFFNSFAGVTFDLRNDGPDPINISGFDVPVTGTVGNSLVFNIFFTTSVATNVGVQTNPAAWTLMGTATVPLATSATAWNLATFTHVPIGGLTLMPGQSKGIYVELDNYPAGSYRYTNGSFTATDGVLTILSNGFGGNVNFGNTNASRAFVGNVYYQAGGEAEIIQTSGLESGSEFPLGTTNNCFEVEDVQGNVGECCFNVTVLEFPNPTLTLACNDNVQISLDDDGCVEVLADMVLEGGPYGCYDDYIVEVLNQFGFPAGNQVCCNLVGQTRTVRVTDPDTGNKCWGTITIEDKLPPVIECNDFTISCALPYNEIPAHPAPEVFTANELFQVPAAISAHGAGAITVAGNLVPGGFFFDLENVAAEELRITALEVRFGSDAFGAVPSPAPVSVYLSVGNTYVGQNTNAAAWTPVALDVPVVVAGPNSEFSLVPLPGNGIQLAAGEKRGMYVMGTQYSLVYNAAAGFIATVTNGDLTLTSGASSGALFTGTFIASRTPNIRFQYGFQSEQIEPSDNCSWEYADPEFVETIAPGNCDGPSEVITRVWTVVDPSGNTASCTQTITRIRPTLNDVELPPHYDGIDEPVLDCSGNFWDTNGNGYPDPGETGVPTIDGDPIVNGDVCNLTHNYTDTKIDICGDSYKILRSWLIIDWCTGEQATYDQLIKVLDQTGPTAVCPQGPVTINVYQSSYQQGGPHTICKGTVVIPPLEITGDDCSGLNPAGYKTELWTLGAGTLLQSLPGNGATFPNVELIADNPPTNNAQYTVRHVFTDACGNVSECIYDIIVVDKVPPVPVCDEITELALTNNGLSGEGCSVLDAANLDDGSYDNCGDVYFYAAKMNPFLTPPYFYQYYPELEFCCDEVGDNMVVVLVLDFDPASVPGATLPDGSIFLFPGNPIFEGSFNTCMVTVGVTDKVPPVTLFCPQGQTITCDTYLANYAAAVAAGDYSVLNGFGAPQFYDNCEYDLTTNVNVNLNNCTEGTITRSWTASDANGQATCTQVITVTHVSNWVVEFPADVTAECIDGQLPDTGEPEIFFDECELIGVSHEDQMFTIVPDACYKIVRTWNVINWCIYDDFGYDAYSEAGKAECNLNIDWDGDGDRDCRTFRDGWNSTGSPGTPDGYISYKQTIKVVDEEAPLFTVDPIDGCIVDTDCDTDIILPYPNITDDCSPTYDVDITGDFGTFNNISGDVTIADVEVGTYTVYYAVTDNCGNTSYLTVVVEVEDCKKPTPLCDNGLVVEIMQTGMVEVCAEAFDEGSWDNCGPIAFFSYSPDTDDACRIFDCDDVLVNPTVQIWVTDIYGNQDYCETVLEVQDNMGACNNATGPAIAGAIATETDNGVEDVEVQVNGGLFSTMTNASGDFTFNGLPAGGDYTVAPQLDVNPGNGVTTFDLVLISRHILGIQLLNSPYKIIAADANKSNGVTTLDMVVIRKVILQIEPGFVNNTSWRFVDKDFVFPNATNPFQSQFPEVINYNNMTLDDLNADFVAIKVGDVNGSAATSLNGDADERSFNGTLNINVEEQQMKAGKTYNVAFTAEAAEVLGYQFTLNLSDAVELVDLIGGVASEENFGLLLEEGAITTSWNVSEARALAQGEVLFTLVVKANADLSVSEAFAASSAYTVAEAYNQNSELMNVNLNFSGVSSDFALYQNVPNPFKGVTVIGFALPEAATATLKVMDVSGKVLQVVTGDYAKGYNEVRLSNLSATGVLYYQLETPTHSATKKMIILE